MLNGAQRWRVLAYSSEQSTAAASASSGTFFKDNEEGREDKNDKSRKERGKLIVVTRSPSKSPMSRLFLGWGWAPLLPVLGTFLKKSDQLPAPFSLKSLVCLLFHEVPLQVDCQHPLPWPTPQLAATGEGWLRHALCRKRCKSEKMEDRVPS